MPKIPSSQIPYYTFPKRIIISKIKQFSFTFLLSCFIYQSRVLLNTIINFLTESKGYFGRFTKGLFGVSPYDISLRSFPLSVQEGPINSPKIHVFSLLHICLFYRMFRPKTKTFSNGNNRDSHEWRSLVFQQIKWLSYCCDYFISFRGPNKTAVLWFCHSESLGRIVAGVGKKMNRRVLNMPVSCRAKSRHLVTNVTGCSDVTGFLHSGPLPVDLQSK
jgi:hypothetical protein